MPVESDSYGERKISLLKIINYYWTFHHQISMQPTQRHQAPQIKALSSMLTLIMLPHPPTPNPPLRQTHPLPHLLIFPRWRPPLNDAELALRPTIMSSLLLLSSLLLFRHWLHLQGQVVVHPRQLLPCRRATTPRQCWGRLRHPSLLSAQSPRQKRKAPSPSLKVSASGNDSLLYCIDSHLISASGRFHILLWYYVLLVVISVCLWTSDTDRYLTCSMPTSVTLGLFCSLVWMHCSSLDVLI